MTAGVTNRGSANRLGSAAAAFGATGLALVFGMTLPFNVILGSVAGQDLRLLDLLGVVLAPLAVRTCLRQDHMLLAVLLFSLVFFLPFLVHALALLRDFDDYRDFVFPLRFLLAFSLCAAMTPLLDNPRDRSWFAAGFCLGCCLNVIPFIFQSLGQHETMVAVGMAPGQLLIPGWEIQQRPPGLHGHANATSAVISLGIPIAIFMAARQQQRWLLACALVALLACSYFTETRSAVVISLATMGFALALFCRTDKILLLLPAVVLTGLLAAGFAEGPLLPESFTRADTAAANLAERLHTTITGLRLALENPLGLGRTLGELAVYERSGVWAIHNALIWLGLVGGPIPMVVAAGCLLAAATRATRPDAAGLRGLLAFHLLGLSLFEDHFQNQTFIALLILVAGGWLSSSLGGDAAPRHLPAPRMMQAARRGQTSLAAAAIPQLAARSGS